MNSVRAESGDSRMIVVGGGVAGLVVARELAKAGLPVVILEATDRLGGQVRRHRVGGLDLDAGAEAFATRTSAVADLATELGLADDIVAPRSQGAWLYTARGVARPLPPASVLGIPSSPASSDVARIIGRVGAARAGLDALLPVRIGSRASTLGSLVRARMGDAMVDGLVAPVVAGVHSAHPDDLPVDRAAPGLRAALARHRTLARAVRSLRSPAGAGPASSGSAVAGIRGGMFRLVEALQSDLERRNVDIRFNVRATDLRPTRVFAGNEELVGRVIAAAPGLFGPATPRTATVVTLVVGCPALDASPRGSGVLVVPNAGVAARAITHQSAKWEWLRQVAPGRHVLRLSYAQTPPDPAATARRDASTLLGVRLGAEDILDSAVVTWARAEIESESREPAIPRVGETVSGTGLAAVVAQAREQAARLVAGRAAGAA